MRATAGQVTRTEVGVTALTPAQAMSITGGTDESPGGWYLEIVIGGGAPPAPKPGPLF